MFRRRRRRHTRREAAGWLGRYVPVTPPGRNWMRCRVLDVSTGGVGLQLPGAEVEIGDIVVVDLQLVRSNLAPVTLTGEVRYAVAVDDGVRIGLRFVQVGDLERMLLLRLVARQKRERRHSGVVVRLAPMRAFD